MDAALNILNTLSESKPAVFMVLHHTFDPEKIVPDSSRFVNRVNTLTVDCLLYEDEGFLDCVKNREALARIHRWQQPQHKQVDSEMVKVSSSEPIPKVEPEYTILVLLGMSVLEKTAVEHMKFVREESRCDASPAPLMKITANNGVVDGEQVAVINTPDWFSSALSREEIKQKIQFCICLSSHRPYALLLVIPGLQSFEEKIVKKWKEVVGESYWEKVIILLTFKGEQQKQVNQVQDLQTKLRNQIHIFSTNKTEDRSQVSELLKKLKKTVPGKYEQHSSCTLS
ncbi:GTPase IMAP family member 4-like [Carassius auratus]|uniref:GTPase IMAP family member 4-like n=1 Tax=Carassius auratus TaxID=7957 RepID=A0A6P6K4F8_CARAU|nr:GTPase IMAP family member 4-like [Carassius auratus]XP_026066946.1 GTPase IMAP family member 4-like [Carassius auratus]XP_026066948.1 GTPase IMAP family member 4-like [Carassius auratus]